MKENKLIAVYGSLKSGFYNNDMLKGQKLLGTDIVESAMQLVGGGGYPYLFKVTGTEHDRDEHEIEIYEVEENVYSVITGMEVGAGYYIDTLQTAHGDATIYYAKDDFHDTEKPYVKKYESGTVTLYK